MWLDRSIVLIYAVLAGLRVVLFTLMTRATFEWVEKVHHWQGGGWAVLFLTLAVAAGIVWITGRFVPTVAGSGLPQVMAALRPEVSAAQWPQFVSLRLSAAKMLLSSAGFLGGLSMGHQGPSVQITAGVMQYARR